jgi:hypothetical protein
MSRAPSSATVPPGNAYVQFALPLAGSITLIPLTPMKREAGQVKVGAAAAGSDRIAPSTPTQQVKMRLIGQAGHVTPILAAQATLAASFATSIVSFI